MQIRGHKDKFKSKICLIVDCSKQNYENIPTMVTMYDGNDVGRYIYPYFWV